MPLLIIGMFVIACALCWLASKLIRRLPHAYQVPVFVFISTQLVSPTVAVGGLTYAFPVPFALAWLFGPAYALEAVAKMPLWHLISFAAVGLVAWQVGKKLFHQPSQRACT